MKTLNRLAGALAIALVLLGALASVALAHAKLVRSEPAADSTVTVAPRAVTIWFNEELDTRQSAITVTAQTGNLRVDTGGSKVNLDDRKQMSVTLQSPLANSIYVVQWHAVTPDDGGVTDGTFQFTLNAPAQTTIVPTAPPATATPTATPAAAATATPVPAATATPAAPATPTPVAPTPTAVAASATPVQPTATIALTTTAPLPATLAPTRAATPTPVPAQSGPGADTIALLAGVAILLLGTGALYLMRRR